MSQKELYHPTTSNTTTTTATNVKIMVTHHKKLWGHLTQIKTLKHVSQVQFKPNRIEEMIDLNQP